MDSNEYLGAAISAFKSLDIDATGTIDFSELLRALFPLATTHHVKLMCVEVKAIELVKKDIETLQKIFEWLDEDFDGRGPLRREKEVTLGGRTVC
jgi:Ca2+-binding EF-hand superfamily protein